MTPEQLLYWLDGYLAHNDADLDTVRVHVAAAVQRDHRRVDDPEPQPPRTRWNQEYAEYMRRMAAADRRAMPQAEWEKAKP